MAFTVLVKTKELMMFRKCGVLVVLTVKNSFGNESFYHSCFHEDPFHLLTNPHCQEFKIKH